jgi:hypothetical protein
MTPPSGLGLVPNKIVGWRIKPDWYNFTVVLVKRHGDSSSKAGQEYEESLAYCRTLENAVSWLIEHVTRVRSEELQSGQFAETGSIADAQALKQAIEMAHVEALKAVSELTRRLEEAGVFAPKQLVHALHEDSSQPEAEASAA